MPTSLLVSGEGTKLIPMCIAWGYTWELTLHSSGEHWDDGSICDTISPDMLSWVFFCLLKQLMTPKRFGNLGEACNNVDITYRKPVIGSHWSLDPECSQA